MFKKYLIKKLFFPVTILVIYGITFAVVPDKALTAFKSSMKIFQNLIFPLCFIFILMLALNLFIKPKHIIKYIGRGMSVRGVIFTTIAGIISMGPIYAWYALLKELKEKGFENSLAAVFLGTRAIKPFLLPVMISYFGWIYTLTLSIYMILGALAVGFCIAVTAKE